MTVSASFLEAQDKVRVRVTDTGVGIAKVRYSV